MDDDIRDIGRRARDDAERALDVDRDLAAVRARSVEQRPTTTQLGDSQMASARVWVGIAAAVAVVATAGGLWLLAEDDESDDVAAPEVTVPPDDTQATGTVPTTTVSTTQGTQPTPTAAPTTTAPITTTPPSVDTGGASVVAASSAEPPPELALDPLASIPYDETTLPAVAIGEIGVIVGLPSESAIASVGFSGEQRVVQLQDELADPDRAPQVVAYGPGDVAYAKLPVGPPFAFEIVAIPLSGPNAGTVVARSEPLDAGRWVELPTSSFGHGIDGIVARTRDVGATLLTYVDIDGRPATPTTPTPDFPEADDSLLITNGNSRVAWQLEIDGQRRPQFAQTGPAVPAPTNARRIIYPTYLGDDQLDGGDDSLGVVAVLSPDGSGVWASLPEGVEYLASDSPGSVFGRFGNGELELHLLSGGPTTWRSLRAEYSGVTETCIGCTNMIVAADGTPISYDRESRVLTRHSTPTVETTLPTSYGDNAFVWHAGPDDVVYLQVDPATPAELAADVVAVTLAAGDAGRELRRWAGVSDSVVDSELVATADGLVNVNCCGPDLVRPSPDAPVRVPWLNRNGDEVTFDVPYAVADVAWPNLTITRVDPLIDAEQIWRLEPGEAWEPRGMPTVTLTHDGGFMATTFGSGGTRVWRGWANGTVDSLDLGDSLIGRFSLDPSGRILIPDGGLYLSVDPFMGPALAQYLARDVTIGPSGEIELDVGATGSVDTSDPVAFANGITGPPTTNEIRVVTAQQLDGSQWGATVTTSNLFDDSSAAVRWELALERTPDGTFAFQSGTQTTVCQPGRGHQQFEFAPCS
ncbi:MAG: hypothetical protein AAGA42_13100 [Actinomycetota bacterium]